MDNFCFNTFLSPAQKKLLRIILYLSRAFLFFWHFLKKEMAETKERGKEEGLNSSDGI